MMSAGRRLPRSRSSLLVLAGLVLVAALVNVVLLVEARSAVDGEDARASALRAAEARVPAMLSYQYAHLEDDLLVASGNATGDFGARYAKVLRDVVLPNARKRKISTQATVQAAGVISSDDSSVDVLVFVNQATTSRSSRQPVTSGSRVVVTMTNTSRGWFVSGLEPV